jgi:hypothetical protein
VTVHGIQGVRYIGPMSADTIQWDEGGWTIRVSGEPTYGDVASVPGEEVLRVAEGVRLPADQAQ